MMKTQRSIYRDFLLNAVQKWISAGARIAIYGTGKHTDCLFRYIPELKMTNITGYLDSDEGRQGKAYRGNVIRPVQWARGNADAILCSSFVNESAMAKAAKGLGCRIFLSHPSIDNSTDWMASTLSVRLNASSNDALLNPPRKSLDILIFSVIDWNYRFQRPQQLAKRMASAGHRVFYIQNSFSGGRRMPVSGVLPNLWTVELPGPANFNLYRDSMNPFLASIVENITMMRSRMKIEAALCLVHFPAWTKPALKLKKLFGWQTVYDCMDYHAGFSNVAPAVVKREKELIKNSDLIFASSHVLQKQILTLNKKCILLPNAGDYDHFSRSTKKRNKRLDRLSHPIIGYYGAISQWFDARLLASLAQRKRDWTFVLVGNTQGSFLGSLKEQPNIVFLPEQDYSKLPQILSAFDVCMLPFKRCRLTHATNPVKIYEYCAAGKPVVSSNLDELIFYQKYVRTPKTIRAWIEAIDKELSKPAGSRSRRLFAQRNQWDHRAQAFLRAINDLR
jgi:glycosyltransferase involved in cell wall biosynthesis